MTGQQLEILTSSLGLATIIVAYVHIYFSTADDPDRWHLYRPWYSSDWKMRRKAHGIWEYRSPADDELPDPADTAF
jgi:hypothetical protein